MFIHCKPYKCNIQIFFPAVLAILLGFLYVSNVSAWSKSEKPRIALLGDSMTWIGGDSCQNETGWTHYMKETGIASEIDVYARSGATWTNTKSTRRNPDHYSEILHDDNVIYNQAIRLIDATDSGKASPDVIVLFAGANDAWFAAKRPGIFDRSEHSAKYDMETAPGEVTSLEGSIRLVSDILQTRFPSATLVFVAPLQMSKTDAGMIFKVSDIIEGVASEKGSITLRADKESGITHRQEAKYPKYTYDGVHTNPEGAAILGKFITTHLLNLPTPQLHN